MKNSFFTVIILFANFILHAQWEKMDNFRNTFDGIIEIDKELYSLSGVLVKSNDDGFHWQNVYSWPYLTIPRSLESKDKDLYLIDYLTFKHSTDLGATWIYAPYYCYDYTVNLNKIILCHIDSVGHRIIRSKDGGLTWEKITHKINNQQTILYEDNIFVFKNIFFFEDSNAHTYYFSNDNGDTWKQFNLPVIGKLFVNGDKLILRNKNEIFYSLDDGNTWINKIVPDIPYTVVSKNNTILAQVDSGKIYKSDDLGDTWFLLPRNNQLFWPGLYEPSPIFISSKDYYYANSAFGLLISKDGGQTWENTNVKNLDNSLSATIIGSIGNVLISSNMELTSRDKGKNWEICYPLTNSFTFSYDKKNMIGYNNPNIYMSKDTGRNFYLVPHNLKDTIFSILLHKDHIYYSSKNGVFKTNDEGKTWYKTKGEILGIDALFNLTSNGKIICGFSYPDNTLYISEDDATSWKKIEPKNIKKSFNYDGFFCFEDLLVWMANNDIFISSDNGQNWKSILNNLAGKGYSFGAEAIAYKDSILYIVGTGLPVHFSNKDLTEWYKVNATNLFVDAGDAIIIVDSTIYLSQLKGTFKMNLSEFLKVANNEIELKEKYISLVPNPASNIVHLSNLPTDTKLNVEILNTQGNLLDAKSINTTSSSLDLNIQNYSSGIYFVRLSSNNQLITTRKLVILK